MRMTLTGRMGQGGQQPPQLRPVEKANFIHLYWDVIWFGIAFGSTLSFLPVYATRVGAAGWQIALLSSAPALVSILLTLPAGRWLERRSQNNALGRAVTRAAFWHRLGLFCLIPLPFFIPAAHQIPSLLLLVALMAVPGTVLMVGFNAVLAATVPPVARGAVVGRRNALLAGAIMVAFLVSGWLLQQLPFATGYTVVFTIGALGGALSTWHVSRLQVPPLPAFQGRPLKEHAQPGRAIGFSGGIPQRASVGLRLLIGSRPTVKTILGDVSGRFMLATGAFFLFHFTQLLPTAIFPIFWVRELSLTDGQIGWLNAAMYLAMLVAAPLLAPLAARFGNFRLMVAGALLLCLYPLLSALSTDFFLLVVASLSGGAVWAILSGAQINRLLELSPEDRRPSHLALYNLALNVAMLVGVMLGPPLASSLGLREALLVTALLRVGSGLTLARWG